MGAVRRGQIARLAAQLVGVRRGPSMPHTERDAMRSLQADGDSRIGLDAQLRHPLEERVLDRRRRSLRELVGDRLVDRCRPSEETLVNDASIMGSFPLGVAVAAR